MSSWMHQPRKKLKVHYPPSTFRATFAVPCKICGEKITKGNYVQLTRQGKTKHPRCVEAA